MSKKLSIAISGRSYDIELEEQFCTFFQKQLQEDFGSHQIGDAKTLLQAYVKKAHRLFVLEEEIAKLNSKLDNLT
ncbi:MAG: hypothetical protein WCR69_06130 [Sulfuricurvum sp.]|jgi:hypothetical protein